MEGEPNKGKRAKKLNSFWSIIGISHSEKLNTSQIQRDREV